MKYVLLGSLGHITRPLAQQLISAGHEVTILSNNPDRQADITAIGAKPAIGSIEDAAFLGKLFKGADAVYTMIPPIANPTNWKQEIVDMGKTIAAGIQAAGVKKVVNLSSIGAHLPEGCGPVSGLHFAEIAMNQLTGVDIKHLRPAYFYTNLLHAIGMIKHAGFYGNNFGKDKKAAMVHPNDIAAVAASELLDLSFTGHSFRYIVGDEKTGTEIAAILGAAIGKPDLPYVEFSDEDATNGAIQAGLPAEIARNFTEMGVSMRTGEMFADYRKHPVALSPIKLTDFAKEFAAAYSKA